MRIRQGRVRKLKKKWPYMLIGATAVAVPLLLLLRPKPDPGRELARRYEFHPVSRMDLSATIDATGTVTALEKKDLYADYEGTVEKVGRKAGDMVRKGQILLVITSSTLKDEWREAESALKQARLNLDLAAAQLATELGLNRISKTNAVQVEALTHQVALQRVQVKQAEKNLAALNARNDGFYAADNERLFIRAPFDGQVAWIGVRQGERITRETLLATVIKPEALGVEALIDENDISQVAVGQEVAVTGNDPARSSIAGTVVEVGYLGQTDGELVSFPIRAELSGAASGLLPGMSVDLTVTAQSRQGVLAVPAAAVIGDNGRDLVAVRRGDRLVRVPVRIGFRQGRFWEVKSGLKPGDLVAVEKLPLPGAEAGRAGSGARPGMGFRRQS